MLISYQLKSWQHKKPNYTIVCHGSKMCKMDILPTYDIEIITLTSRYKFFLSSVLERRNIDKLRSEKIMLVQFSTLDG